MDMPRRGIDRFALWRRFGPAKHFCRRGWQHSHLLYLFRLAAIRVGPGYRRHSALVAGGMVSEYGLRVSGGVVDDHDPMNLMPDELSELKARYDRLNLLYQVGNVIHSTLEPQEALQLILHEAVRLMRASSGSAVLINPTTGFLEILASEGLPPDAAQLKLRIGEGITGW